MRNWKVALLAMIIGTAISTYTVFAEGGAQSPDGASAPSALSKDELGHLVHFSKITFQDLDDWRGWEASDQKGMEAYRYQIAFMTYALALQQYNSVPAWREVHQEMTDRLIQRMIEKPVWEFWEEVSKGSKVFDPGLEFPHESKRDPVGEKNIMYSGHLVHMAALYEMLYADDKWSQPAAFTFRWDDEERFEYDQQSLLKLIHAEMLAPKMNNDKCIAGVECEPNLIFPECQQHPLMAFQLNDQLKGTDLYPAAKNALDEFFDCIEMYDPSTKSVANAFRVRQAYLVRLPKTMPSPSADGWTGAFTYTWKPDIVTASYKAQREMDIQWNEDGSIKRMAVEPLFNLGAGFFSLLAVELGDLETAAAIYDYADKHLQPKWDSGGLSYTPSRDPRHVCSNTADRILAMAKSNRPGGLTRLHHEPWDADDHAYPLVTGVDFPRVLIREARWVNDGTTLIVDLLQGHDAPETTSFQISGAQADDGWMLMAGGESLGTLGSDNIATGALSRDAESGTPVIKVDLKEGIRLELHRNP